MKLHLQILVISLLNLLSSHAFCQKGPVYDLEKRLRNGDKAALLEIAPYFDQKTEVIEFLGYHIIETNEAQVAKRVVDENCIFTENEIVISKKTTAADFLAFLKNNYNKITFSEYAQAFLLTPLEERTVKVEFRKVSTAKEAEVKRNYLKLLSCEWVKKNGIASVVESRNPKALLLIASQLYKIRYRFNSNHSNQKEYTDLLTSLTHLEIAVEDEKKRLSWHVDKEFYPDASLNLLIYFAKNYKDYKWNSQQAIFKSDNIVVKPLSIEDELFDQLASERDSTALRAFTQLTTCNPEKVVQLSDEYWRASIDANYALPTFPYDFLKQIVRLTDYCRNNNIDFAGSPQLKADIARLKTDLSFAERRKLENKLIENLSLDEITALEYWTLINEKNCCLPFSTGRILDIFYSRNWKQLINNEQQLKLYLKKAYLFSGLSIIGNCNAYLQKFTNNGANTAETLSQINTDDKHINAAIEQARLICLLPIEPFGDTMKVNNGNKDFDLTDVAESIKIIKNKKQDYKKMQDELGELLSQINYSQIGTALRAIEGIVFKTNKWDKYTFMSRDWGFLTEENFDMGSTRKKFLALYDSLSEYELYEYYLDRNHIDYKNNYGNFDYDKVFEILKYNVVTAFVGGGGGRMGNEVYSVIKLLELKHNTTLGYPKKLCNSNNMYYCDSKDRANEWMKYLRSNKLLQQAHDEPMAFDYEKIREARRNSVKAKKDN